MTRDEQNEKVSELIGILKYTKRLAIDLKDASVTDYNDVDPGPADLFLSERIDKTVQVQVLIQLAIKEASSLNEEQNKFFQTNKNEDND